MDILSFIENDILFLIPEGRIDSTNATLFEENVLSVLSKAQKVAIDFSKINYISSAGLRAVLIVAKEINKSSRKLALYGMNSSIKDVFDMAGFSTVIPTTSLKEDVIGILS